MPRASLAATLFVCATACQTQTPSSPAPRTAPVTLSAKAKVAPVHKDAPDVAAKRAPAPQPDQGAMGKQELQQKVASSGILGEVRGGETRGHLYGSAVGDAQGQAGLGLRGEGSGGGGLGGSIGIGNVGTYGRGGGTGAGYPHLSKGAVEVRGYGSGAGMLGAKGTSGGPAVYGAYDARLRGDPVANSEEYGHYDANVWTLAARDHLSTFAADVDTASYTIARRKLLEGTLPPSDSVRVEEWLNYFRYHYPQPTQGALGVSLEAAPSPFSSGKTLLRVGVQGKQLGVSERKTAHLTFLVDVSGSMQSADKLPLAKRALRMLVDNLRDGDTVALVTYAGGVKLVLGPTGMEEKAKIHAAIEDLRAGGSTAMAGGIELAYQQAEKTLDSQSFSRVIILSDGDANVGATSHEAILKLIQGHVKEGVTVTTVGFGMGNYKDNLMEQFADKGNGNHYYCDSLFEAKRIFVEQLGGTLEVIAQDVKLQVDFDPAQVRRYRLVGYENRDVRDEDFRNDKVDGGEIGSGHQVTAMYEVELAPGAGADWAKVHVRAKKPRGTEAAETVFALTKEQVRPAFDSASGDFRFATAVMGAAEIFRRSSAAGDWSYQTVLDVARGATPEGNAERQEFVLLLQQARAVAQQLASR